MPGIDPHESDVPLPTDPPIRHPEPSDYDTLIRQGLAFSWSPDAIVISDADGRIVDANPAALALLGYTHEELLQLNRTDLVPPSPAWTADRYAQFLRDGRWTGEVEVRTKGGVRLRSARAGAPG